MDTTIYYFTGTGNSLKIASDLSENISNSKIVQICKNNLNQNNGSTSQKIGIVFPVYFLGMPLIVKEFIENLKIDKNSYVFAIANCGSAVGGAIKQLERILENKGVSLSAGYKMVMPDNYLISFSPPSMKRQQKMFKNQKDAVVRISNDVNTNKIVNFHEDGKLFMKAISVPLYKFFKPYEKDINFSTNEKCNGCEICSKVCPANNIIMSDKKPNWQHSCEQCLACVQWCPQNSIQYKRHTLKKARYHHPDIKAHELFQNNLNL